MKLQYFTLIFLFLNSWALAQKTSNPSAGEMLKDQGYKLYYEDGFNKPGKPSASDWLYRDNKKMGGVSWPGNVVESKVAGGEGCLLIKYTYDDTRKKGEQFLGGGVVSVHNFGYGYYETRVKLYGGTKEQAGLHQSFWTMGLTGTNEAEGAKVRDSLVNIDAIPQENKVLEIDGFEQDSRGNVLAQNYHIYTPVHLSTFSKPNYLGKDLSKWIVMGYEWLPDKINIYSDGKMISTFKLEGKWQVFAPQNFWLTALPIISAGGLKMPEKDAAMQVDYFRYYAKKLPGVNRLGNADFEYGVKNNSYPLAWIVARTRGNDMTAVKVVTDSTASKNGKRFLLHQKNTPYQATTKQILEYIPNGKYVFSAWVKSSGGQKKAAFVIKSGGREKTLMISGASSWTKISIDKLTVKGHQAIVEIQSVADANQWLMVDNMEFSEVD